MKITRSGVDLAKSVFHLHGVDRAEKKVLTRQLKRAQMIPFFQKLEPCLIGMEACASAHYWARTLAAMGHTVKLIAPQFVKPYVKGNKNDANDAAAVCEAASRPSMRFVPMKSAVQQGQLAVHRLREGYKRINRCIPSGPLWRVYPLRFSAFVMCPLCAATVADFPDCTASVCIFVLACVALVTVQQAKKGRFDLLNLAHLSSLKLKSRADSHKAIA